VRFYWFDGKAPQGPFDLSELLTQPGFNSESVVCPVGAERPEDWKPAVSYEPVRDALFKPKSPLLSSPPPIQPPCPFCRHQNPDDALFCSRCGRNLKESPPSPDSSRQAQTPAPMLSALPIGPAVPPLSTAPRPPEQAPEPVGENPSPNGSALPKAPELSAGPKRGPVPGKMGRLAQSQPQPKAPIQPPASVKPAAASMPGNRLMPKSAAPAASSAAKNRPLLLAAAAFCAASIVLAGVFLWRRPMHPKKSKPPVVLTPPPAAPLEKKESSPAPAAAKSTAAPAPPAPPPPAGRKKNKAKPAAARTARKSRPAAPPPSGAASSEKAVPDKTGLASPTAPPPAAKKSAPEFLLPGLTKKVSKPGNAAASDPPPAKPDDGTGPASTEQLLADKAKEQFSFCHSLLQEGRFGDFYDTCLCSGARNAAPYKGNRRTFIERFSQDPDSEIGSTVELVDTRVDGETASITAKWSKADGTSQRTEKWGIEDDLWCLKK
jgi:hypothetical protein